MIKGLADIQVGDRVTVTRNATTGVVSYVDVDTPHFDVAQECVTDGVVTRAPFTLSETQFLLDDVVNERPDYVYKDEHAYCDYRDDGSPSCLIGHVVAHAGLPIALLTEGIPVNELCAAQRWFTPDALAFLRRAQIAQDQGASWGVARNIAWAMS